MRTYGESGCKKVELLRVSCKVFRGFCKAQLKAKRTSCPAFFVRFTSFYKVELLFLVLCGSDQFHSVKMRNDGFKCVFPQDKLVFRHNVWVVVKHGDVKKGREIFEHACGTRSATRVQKQTWLCSVFCVFESVYLVFDRAFLNVFHALSIAPFSFGNN